MATSQVAPLVPSAPPPPYGAGDVYGASQGAAPPPNYAQYSQYPGYNGYPQGSPPREEGTTAYGGNGGQRMAAEQDNIQRSVTPQFGRSFSDKAIRHAFIKKVYLILMIQLLFTVGIICLFVFCVPVKGWVQSNSWFYWISYAVFLVTYITLVCIPALRRSFPVNFICLAIFTVALTYMAATISSYYDTTIVLVAIAVTAGVCFCISLFAIQTRIDFTMCTGILFALCMVVVLFGLACLITFLIVGNTFATYVMSIVYGSLAALLMSLFLVFDTQMVVGGKNRKMQLSPEEYITGALQLYLDIVYLFLIILGLAGAAK